MANIQCMVVSGNLTIKPELKTTEKTGKEYYKMVMYKKQMRENAQKVKFVVRVNADNNIVAGKLDKGDPIEAVFTNAEFWGDGTITVVSGWASKFKSFKPWSKNYSNPEPDS